MSPWVLVLVFGRNSPALCLLRLLSMCLSPGGRQVAPVLVLSGGHPLAHPHVCERHRLVSLRPKLPQPKRPTPMK